MKLYRVYILTNVSRSTLYTGITSTLSGRIWDHKEKVHSGFTARYNVNRLVYFENFLRVGDAIAREKQLKGWRRSKKIALIEAINPRWDDLSREWADAFKPEKPQVLRLATPRS